MSFKITDPKMEFTPEMQGKIMRVGKKDFGRICIKGMYKWWEDGFEEMAKGKDEKTGEEHFMYRKGDEWFLEK